jgi:hypothetical protein
VVSLFTLADESDGCKGSEARQRTATVGVTLWLTTDRLYGTASEHAVFYQFNFNKAANVFAGLLQTESPYYQPTPPPPAPFKAAVGLFPGDPDYKLGCLPSSIPVVSGKST